MSTNNGATPPSPTPSTERPRDVRTRTVTFSIGDDVDQALRALYATGRSAYVDRLLREQPAIREWLAQHMKGESNAAL